MNREDMLQLLDYDYWATKRVLVAANRATEDELHAASPTSGQTIHNTLVHMMAAEQIWRLRCHGDSPANLADPADYPALAELISAWETEEKAMRDYVAGLTDANLADTVRYHNTKGVAFEQKVWQILAHVINHGTQHRSEVAFLLTELGYSPGDVDFMLYLREQDRTGSQVL